jgi:mannan endo-1,4-beta-mannosidase
MKRFLKVMMNLFLYAGILLILNSSCRNPKINPVNPNATTEARQLLEYLYSISGKQILSGQHNYPHELTRSTDSIIAITGKKPVVWGTDVSSLSNTLFEEAQRQYNQGAIITLMYHQVKPFHHDSLGFEKSVKGMVSNEEWEQIVSPGTEYHRMWLEKIDQRAEFLKKFRDAGIPVLWRPYHEMNGMWFWYGNRQGENGIQKLWKMMYDRYTNNHQLNNLIWVWNANAPRDWKDDEAYDYQLFYPGNDYVDVLAADIYKGDYKQSHHDQLVELGKGKLIALGEIGDMPPPEILEQQPQWSWFMCWARFPWTHNTPDEVRAIYNHPKTITFDEINLKEIRK